MNWLVADGDATAGFVRATARVTRVTPAGATPEAARSGVSEDGNPRAPLLDSGPVVGAVGACTRRGAPYDSTLRKSAIISANAMSVDSGSYLGPSSRMKACSPG